MISAWLILIILAYLLHSFSTTIDKFLLKHFNSNITGLIKMGTNTIFLLVIALVFFIGELASITNWLYYLVALGFLYALGTILYFFAIQRGAISELVPYDFSLTIAITFFLASFIFKESITSLNIVGIALIFFGIWFILARKGKVIPKFSLPLLITSIHVIVIVVYQLLSKVVSMELNPFLISLNMYFFCSVFLLIFILFFNRDKMRMNFSVFRKKKSIIFWLAIGSLTGVFGTTFIYMALSLGAATKVLPVSGILPFFIVLWGGAFFKERNILQKVIGAVLIFAGIFLIAV